MYFSIKEKEIIKQVDSEQIYDLSSYLKVMVPLKSEINNSTKNFTIPGQGDIQKGQDFYMVENERAITRELYFFIALCNKLQRFQLLTIIEYKGIKPFLPMLMKQGDGLYIPSDIYNLFANNKSFEIVRFGDLKQFIQDGFLTHEEKNLPDERNARNKAQNTTILVAALSLFFSIAIAIGTAIFNYKTFTIERKVLISNLDAIQYPIPVSIMKLPNQPEVTPKLLPIPK